MFAGQIPSTGPGRHRVLLVGDAFGDTLDGAVVRSLFDALLTQGSAVSVKHVGAPVDARHRARFASLRDRETMGARTDDAICVLRPGDAVSVRQALSAQCGRLTAVPLGAEDGAWDDPSALRGFGAVWGVTASATDRLRAAGFDARFIGLNAQVAPPVAASVTAQPMAPRTARRVLVLVGDAPGECEALSALFARIGRAWSEGGIAATIMMPDHPAGSAQALAARLGGAARLIGALDDARDLGALIADFDAVLTQSPTARFQLPLAQAMWSGVPVIAPPNAVSLCGLRRDEPEGDSVLALAMRLARVPGALREGFAEGWRQVRETHSAAAVAVRIARQMQGYPRRAEIIPMQAARA